MNLSSLKQCDCPGLASPQAQSHFVAAQNTEHKIRPKILEQSNGFKPHVHSIKKMDSGNHSDIVIKLYVVITVHFSMCNLK